MSKIRIYISPNNAWDYYVEHLVELQKTLACVMENESTGWGIYITDSGKGFAELRVVDKFNIDHEIRLTSGALDTADMIASLAVKFINSPDEESKDEEPPEDIEDALYERLDTCNMALMDYLSIMLEDKDGEFTSSLSEEELTDVNQIIVDVLVSEGYLVHFPKLDGGKFTSEWQYDPACWSEDDISYETQ